MSSAILAIDQGTTSTRALVFDQRLGVTGSAQQEIAQHYPGPGEVEHDAEEIWATVVATARQAIGAAGHHASDIAAIGITNQRETVVLWDRRTGKPVHRAIVWQDRRTAPLCRQLAADGLESLVAQRTGLRLDPYFSASKITWLLDTIDGLRAAAEAGHIAFGTIDSWLIHCLTGGRVHATDATNAARTALFDIHTGHWDEALLAAFRVPRAMLPEVRDCNADFGVADPAIFGGAIRICGVAGDQQAATIGQACFSPGMTKATYGTGCFVLLNTGRDAIASRQRLLTTIAYQLDGQRTYALEGAIFIAGAAVQWLRDGLKLIATASETDALAAAADRGQHVVLVPAFVGLGAPYWQPDARGALFGLTRATGPRELARAVLDATAFQTRDLLDAMRRDWAGDEPTVLRVDGGMVASDYVLQGLANALAAPVERAAILETTALGAAWLAGHKAGVWPGMDGFGAMWRLERRFDPQLPAAEREAEYARWKRAVAAVIAYSGAPGETDMAEGD